MRCFQIKILLRMVTLLVCLTSTSLLPILAYSAEPVRIGILAFRSKQQTLEQWQPLAIALKQAMPERDFVVDALTYPELEKATASDALDFVLTNPAHYVLLTKRIRLSAPLATLASIENNQPVAVFGGIIFTRAEQSNINVLSDIKNKTIAATNTDSFGGYQMQSYALRQVGVNLSQDAKIIFTGMPHDNVVNAVLNKRADVGFVRTGLLESMVREGKLDIKKIKIINRQRTHGFPVQASTKLYPEWAFASMPNVQEDIARHVAAALFVLEENTAATRAMNIHGFVVPADYTSVADLLKELRVKPFDAPPHFTLTDVWARYQYTLIVALVALGLIVLLSIRLLLIRRKLDEEHCVVLQQQEQSREREVHLNTLLESTSECVKILSNDGTLLSMNSAGLSLIEASSQDVVINQCVYPIVAPEHRAAFKAFNEAVCTGQTGSLEFEIIGLNGTRRWMSTRAVPFTTKQNNEITQLAFTREITERKKLEQQKEQYYNFFQLSTDPMCIADPYGCFKQVNPAFVRLLGFSAEELLDRPFLEFVLPEDREETAAELKAQVELRPSLNFENRYVCKDGGVKLLSWTAYFDKNESFTYATAKDITLLRQSEIDLRIAAIAFKSQEGIFVTDTNCVIIRTNQAFTTITGFQAEDAIGETPRLIASGQHDALFYADMWQAIHSNGHWAGEIWNRRKNGEIHPEHLTITAVTDMKGVVINYVAALIDISESKQREQQRIMDEASLRQTLVREVHHRIKNNLQGVSSLLSHFVSKVPELAAPVSEAISQMQSIAIIHGLHGSSALMSVGLCELVRNVAANNQALWKTSITVDSPLPLVLCLVAEPETVNIALVLNELIANAIKHGDAEKCVHITYEYSLSPLQVQLLIANTGQLSNDVCLSKTPALHPTTGTGLELVSSLLGKSGSVVTWEQCGDIVITKLKLNPPVITLNSEQ
jgi:PAS domain S-box-containing protein